MSEPAHHQHDAPLLRLVQQLHAGSTLGERVRRLRYKRRKVRTVEAVEQVVTATEPTAKAAK